MRVLRNELGARSFRNVSVMMTGHVVLNQESDFTCMRQGRGSVIDVSFAFPSGARRIGGWHVSSAETLSDHLYTRFDFSAGGGVPDHHHPQRTGTRSPHWALRRLNKGVLMETSAV